MIDIINAARYFVYLSYGKNKYSLTPLKLQKLLYLSQGWSYVWDEKPLFEAEFCAWKWGPVNEDIYNLFCKYGREEIPKHEGLLLLEEGDVHELSEAKSTIEAVWEMYCKYNAFALVEITHSQKPWQEAYPDGGTITNESIKKYFQSTYSY